MTWTILSSILLVLAVGVAIIASSAMAIMSDAYQRLHFPGVVVAISGPLIAAAVWMSDHRAQSRIKILLILLTLLFTNAVLSHATARAIRIRRREQWSLKPDEPVTIVSAAPEQTGQEAEE